MKGKPFFLWFIFILFRFGYIFCASLPLQTQNKVIPIPIGFTLEINL